MFIEDTQLHKFILDSNLVSKADLDNAQKEADKKGLRIGEVLVNSGKITEDNLRRMQAYVLGIPFVDLKSRKILLRRIFHIYIQSYLYTQYYT